MMLGSDIRVMVLILTIFQPSSEIAGGAQIAYLSQDSSEDREECGDCLGISPDSGKDSDLNFNLDQWLSTTVRGCVAVDMN